MVPRGVNRPVEYLLYYTFNLKSNVIILSLLKLSIYFIPRKFYEKLKGCVSTFFCIVFLVNWLK
jgi:hypothetical protein